MGNIGTGTVPAILLEGAGGARRRQRGRYSVKHAAVVVLSFISLVVQLSLLETISVSTVGGGGSFLVSAFSPCHVPGMIRHSGAAITANDVSNSFMATPSLLFMNTNANENSDSSPFNDDDAAVVAAARRTATLSSTYSSSPSTLPPKPRTIRVERMVRLPVWPVWAGVIDFFVGWIFGAEVGSKLEQYYLGGRVCPMQLDGKTTSPFLLLVHHHHNFWKWDFLFRKLSAFVLPEGFPAHPHRGFTTLTYFLPDDNDDKGKGGGGGFVHRDSIGVKQTYGSKGSYKHQAQWLFTGKGMLHEEMFDFLQNEFSDSQQYNSRYELYQLWVNVPGQNKLDPPQVQLLSTGDGDGDGDDSSMPTVSTTSTTTAAAVTSSTSSATEERTTTNCDVVVIAGDYQTDFRSQAAPLHSDLSVLHVTVMETAATSTATRNEDNVGSSAPGWTYDIPTNHDTLIVYVRKGSCTMETTTATSTSTSASTPTTVPIHSTVFIEKDQQQAQTNVERLIVRPTKLGDPVDLLVLSACPLYDESSNSYTKNVEAVAMQGSMVMNNDAQIQDAYRDYQQGQMGVPWDHTLEDEEWMEHVRQTRSRQQ